MSEEGSDEDPEDAPDVREAFMQIMFSADDDAEIEEADENGTIKSHSGYNIHVPDVGDKIALASVVFDADDDEQSSGPEDIQHYTVTDKYIHYVDTMFVEGDEVDNPATPVTYIYIDVEYRDVGQDEDESSQES